MTRVVKEEKRPKQCHLVTDEATQKKARDKAKAEGRTIKGYIKKLIDEDCAAG